MAGLFGERKKKVLALLEDPRYVPMKEKELAVLMQVKPEDREAFKEVLRELLEEGSVVLTRRGRYTLAQERTEEGTFLATSRGFGFVSVEGQTGDFLIPEDCVHGALHQDRVRIRILPEKRGERTRAEVIQILERGITFAVGTYQESPNYGFVLPDSEKLGKDIFIPKEKRNGAFDGMKVVARITDYGDGRKNPEGEITEILGAPDAPGVDILSIVRSFGITDSFGARALAQAERCPREVSEADRQGRRDLRGVRTVTIDGEDAKDLDDAVSLTVQNGRYHLGVHIADVSNYVQENSALDREAKERGTSVYLADRVIPMLPFELSNGICSLNAGQDRLALSCLMELDETGIVTDYEIVESVIRVDRRMSYTQVKRILEDKEESLREEYRDFVPMFEDMARLSALLRKRRQERGAVDFDFPECRIFLDPDGRPKEIRPYEHNVATRLIEDFMLAANETVAQHFYWLEVPFVYRVHEKPDPERMEKLDIFLKNFGYHLKKGREGEIYPGQLQKILGKVQGTAEEGLISRLVLRSMKRAVYSTECAGHFGLATPYYCHFTSPIRRYPDLQIHRIIREFLRGRMKEDRADHYREILPQTARHCSQMQRRADEAERETDRLKKAEYMQDRLGQHYEAVISGVTAWGLYVELPNTVEGLVPVGRMEEDFFLYDEKNYALTGERTNRTYRLGQRVSVRAVYADPSSRSVEFALEQQEDGHGERSAETDCER